ncbi:MAG: type II secretion system major pseudopilin GspG [Kiritimatiellae bacterium]|nr:type II secretion system major pseudopilin GspG [Kiritimatiellia bacterium]
MNAHPATARAGFTLVEILIAVTIVVILGAVVGVNVLDAPQKARVGAARQQLSAFKTALGLYAADNGAVPTAEQGLEALVAPAARPPLPAAFPPGGYLEKASVPADPWGRPYAYFAPGRAGEPFEIVCYGADGEEGGSGYAADLSSSAL